MSKVQTLKVFVKQRLTAAFEEIFELFERTIAEYEEELCRQSKLLGDAGKSDVQNTAGVWRLLLKRSYVKVHTFIVEGPGRICLHTVIFLIWCNIPVHTVY